ncbi:MAG: extracellular solute-binding protein [Gaiellales bacterium]
MSLSILAWDHPRATLPLAAASRAWAELSGEPFAVATRSLAAFGDETPDAGRHDLVLIDHPHIGQAATSGAIVALDRLVAPEELAMIEASAVGPPDIYHWDRTCWGVPLDAACQALAVNPGQLGDHGIPQTWDDVLELARAMPGAVALPLHPAHAISSCLSLVAAHGGQVGGPLIAERSTLEWAVSTLAVLAEIAPEEAFEWEPPEALERLARGELACIPLVYAYVGYAVTWSDAARLDRDGPPGAILGGVGAAVLSGSDDPEAAARLAVWLATPAVQRDIVGRNGGQPASRAAWDDPAADPLFAAVRETLEQSRVRPRDPWWPAFQLAGGEQLARGLRSRCDPALLADELGQIYHEHRSRSR